MNTATLINEVISLPVEERTLVVESLLASLNQPESAVDAKWAAVAKKRLDDLLTKKTSAVDGKQVFEKIWQRFES